MNSFTVFIIHFLIIFFFFQAKYDQNRALEKEMILPKVRKDGNLLLHNVTLEHYSNDGNPQNGILLSNAKPEADVKLLISPPWTSGQKLETRPHMESKPRDSRNFHFV